MFQTSLIAVDYEKLSNFRFLNFSVKRFCVQVLKIVFSSLSQSQHTHNDLWAPSDRRNSQPWESYTQVGSRSVSMYRIHQSVSRLSLSSKICQLVAQSLHVTLWSCTVNHLLFMCVKVYQVFDYIYVTNISISELVFALCRLSTSFQAWFLCISHLISNKLSAGCKNSRIFSLSGAVF